MVEMIRVFRGVRVVNLKAKWSSSPSPSPRKAHTSCPLFQERQESEVSCPPHATRVLLTTERVWPRLPLARVGVEMRSRRRVWSVYFFVN